VSAGLPGSSTSTTERQASGREPSRLDRSSTWAGSPLDVERPFPPTPPRRSAVGTP